MRIPAIILLSLVFLTGCASLKVDTSGSRIISPICLLDNPKIDTVVLWGALWRSDQKEPLLRESMAKQGIEIFISETKCINVPAVDQITLDSQPPSNQALIEQTAKYSANQLIFILVRELGPTIEIGIPSIIEGHTEVLLEVKVIDLSSNAVTNDSRVHWKQGGKFVIKSTKSLSEDMASALHVILTTKDGQ